MPTSSSVITWLQKGWVCKKLTSDTKYYRVLTVETNRVKKDSLLDDFISYAIPEPERVIADLKDIGVYTVSGTVLVLRFIEQNPNTINLAKQLFKLP